MYLNTSLAADIFAFPNQSGNPRNLVALNGTVYFIADDAIGSGLWKSNGTQATTSMVKDINPGSSDEISALAVFNNALYFNGGAATGNELYKSDGTTAGTGILLDINPTGDSTPLNFCVVGT